MIYSLLATISIETILAAAYAALFHKPVRTMAFCSIGMNSLTQLMLFGALRAFPGHYWSLLLPAEAVILLIEAAILHFFRSNQLKMGEAMAVSLILNLASFGTGLFLPF